jgi:hypothetical protein
MILASIIPPIQNDRGLFYVQSLLLIYSIRSIKQKYRILVMKKNSIHSNVQNQNISDSLPPNVHEQNAHKIFHVKISKLENMGGRGG